MRLPFGARGFESHRLRQIKSRWILPPAFNFSKSHVLDSDPRGRDRLGEGPVNLRVDHGPAATERGAAGGSLPQLWLPSIMFF